MALLDLFKESIIIQSTITLIVIGVTGYMVVTMKTEHLPEQWWAIVSLFVGYWVGSKGNFQAAQANKRTMEAIERISVRGRDCES